MPSPGIDRISKGISEHVLTNQSSRKSQHGIVRLLMIATCQTMQIASVKNFRPVNDEYIIISSWHKENHSFLN